MIDRAQKFYEEDVIGRMMVSLRNSQRTNDYMLCALGCLVYTEIIGFLLPQLEIESGKLEEKRFYRCFYRLRSANYLIKSDKIIRNKTSHSLYWQLRHGMTHRYYPRISSWRDGSAKFLSFEITGELIDKNGNFISPIYFDMPKSSGVNVHFGMKNYVDELEEAVKRFYDLTFIDKDRNFILAAKSGMEKLLKDNH